MKNGKTLVELAQEIERQRNAKMDFAAPVKSMKTAIHDNSLVLQADGHTYRMQDLAITQAAQRHGVPVRYVRKMQEERPELLAHNLNEWFGSSNDRSLVRTLDGSARAFLSDRYQRIDNADVAEVVIPVLAAYPTLEFRSMEITESRLYIKASLPAMTREIKSRRVGDLVEAGVMITNSEVGLGAVTVTPFAYFLACTNGMVRDGVKRWNHIGGRISGDEIAYLSDETVAASDRADLLKIRDTLAHALSETKFESWIDKLQATTDQRISGDVAKGIEVLSQKLVMTKAEGDSVLRHLIEGGDLSRYGMLNAVTRTAQDLQNYDRATEVEALGQRVIDLPANEWRQIAEAA